MNPIKYATLLYAEPSIWDGLTRILDISGGFGDYNDSDSDEEADAIALASDWYAVGADLHRAMSRYNALANQADTNNG